MKDAHQQRPCEVHMDGISTGGAILWWIGIAVLVLVVIPLVLILSQRVLRHLREIRDYAADIRTHGVGVTENVAPVPALLQTRHLVKALGPRLDQYAGAAGRLLNGGQR
jgi:hypothetical protein